MFVTVTDSQFYIWNKVNLAGKQGHFQILHPLLADSRDLELA